MTVRAIATAIPTCPPASLHLSPRAGSLIALVAGAVLIGVSTLATEATLADINPLTLALARFGVAAAALLAICRLKGVRPQFGRAPALLGLTGVTLAFTCQNIGMQDTGAMDATLIIEGSVPIVTALLGTMVLRERMTRKRIAGLTLAVGGIAVVILQGGEGDAGSFSIRGGLLTLLARIWFAVYTVAGRRAFAGQASMPVLAGSVIIGMAALVPGAIFECVTDGPGRFTLPAVGCVLLLGLGGSTLVHILWAHGLAHLEATEVGIIGTLMPVVGVALAAVVLGEPMTVIQFGGAALVAAGLGVTTISIRRSTRSSAKEK